jgi:DNA-binding response OmpR family regulator
MPDHKPLRVLIVDDEPLITIFIKRIVQEAGDRVLELCYDCDHALRAIKETQPDLIFMDINIKGHLDGISVIKRAAPGDAVVYYISAYTSDAIVEEALSTDPYNYLFKPIKEVEIKTALELCRRKKNPCIEKAAHHVKLADDLFFDMQQHMLLQNGSPVVLTKTEQKLMALFAGNLNIVLTYETLREGVWGGKSVANSTMRDTISKLRLKCPEINIYTYYGVGYRLIPSD